MTLRQLPSRLLTATPSLFALALLAGCAQDGPPPEPPLDPEALEAVAEDPGAPRERLARAIDDLFTAEDMGETQALVLMRGGEIVAERYAEGFEPGMRFTGWSMSKSVTAVLVGMLVADGRLALDNSAPVANWQRPGDPRSAVTLRHLLQMRSGLRHREGGDPPYASHDVRMLFMDGRDDTAGWAEAQPLEYEPGSTFTYSSATTAILSDIASDTIAPGASPQVRQQAMAEFLEDRLAVPLGMETLAGEYDRSGTLLGASHIWASPRDWAKFGEFLRNYGSVAGAQIVPRGWIEFMRRPSPAADDYGGQLWLNRPVDGDRSALFGGALGEDIFGAVGHLGQYLIVAPERRLTLVRLGTTPDEGRERLTEELADIVALYPSR
ncbi:serine hydrolase domain-containing protein [Aurantiacibacter poecillastricola]|uniref:serine hydrolase domain-containing protein n=1 Tax=Aurantiacibacter poecillastricola TaxID=3064385 RepID=UPI00273DB2C4|nr:serine hydrolase [Aurantiacibacter sp. 219JJ12-13]MDP5260450.1 serine hydrolase [Aurantiacibacter sp. 219JJ12-13]